METISVIITTYKEYKTLSRAIQVILHSIQNLKFDIQGFEILIIGPDKKTQEIVEKFSKIHQQVKYLKDKGVGKPAALNLALRAAKGQILVLTDGDVWIDQKSIHEILQPFKNRKVGAVTGRPISINSRKTLFGYWSHFLTQAAHQMRLKKQNFPCSGYLYGFRNVIKQIPENVFSEDGVITQMIRDSGFNLVYVPEAKVYVKYPDNFNDWIKQKVRSTGGYLQKSQTNSKFQIPNSKFKKMRSFGQELLGGIKLFFVYPKNIKEFFWTILLYLARLYLWLMIFWNIKVKNKKFAEIWQRVESTKR